MKLSDLFRLFGAATLFALPGMAFSTSAAAQEVFESALVPAHETLASLTGEWGVFLGGEQVGEAVGEARFGGRFVEIALTSNTGPVRQAIYTFGFDDRHDDFTVIAMDQSGNYWVTARGKLTDGSIRMYGEDDDPVMTSMGLKKEFVIELGIGLSDRATIATRFIDNRTEERRELPFLEFQLRR